MSEKKVKKMSEKCPTNVSEKKVKKKKVKCPKNVLKKSLKKFHKNVRQMCPQKK